MLIRGTLALLCTSQETFNGRSGKLEERNLQWRERVLHNLATQRKCLAVCRNLAEKSCTQGKAVAPLFANPGGLAQVAGRLWAPEECFQPTCCCCISDGTVPGSPKHKCPRGAARTTLDESASCPAGGQEGWDKQGHWEVLIWEEFTLLGKYKSLPLCWVPIELHNG